jgi:hypothetical protein
MISVFVFGENEMNGRGGSDRKPPSASAAGRTMTPRAALDARGLMDLDARPGPPRAALRIALLVLAATVAPAAAQAPAAGTIEICRVAGARDRDEGKRLDIPKGAVFGDTGRRDGPDHGGRYWPLWIATTRAVSIDVTERCATAPAQITANMDRHRLQVGDARLFLPSVAAYGALPDWPGGRRLTATATTDFK